MKVYLPARIGKNSSGISFVVVVAILLSLSGCLHSALDVSTGEEPTVIYSTPGTMGNINGGGRSGVDAWCENNKPQNLSCGEIHALLSVDGNDTIYNLDKKFPSLPWTADIYNADKTKKIADNWGDLTDGTIGVTMREALGNLNGHWTGGTAGTVTCGNWTNNGAGWWGYMGHINWRDFNWIDNGQFACSSTRHVLCICWDKE